MEKIELDYWKRKWELDENLIYKKAALSQASFVKGSICGNLLKARGFVVSTHCSKSCELPVYFIKLRNGIKLIMRCNFYDWKISVDIPEEYDILPANYLPTDCLSHCLVENATDKIPLCYLEGFKKEWSFDAYIPEQPGKRFTIEIPDDERLYVIIHYLKHAYPDKVFNPEDDQRTIEEIKASVENIINANGYNDWYDDTSWGKPHKRRIMSAWEILWRTYCIMDDMSSEIRKEFGSSMCIENDPQRYAETIKRFPEIHKEFLMEEWMFNE